MLLSITFCNVSEIRDVASSSFAACTRKVRYMGLKRSDITKIVNWNNLSYQYYTIFKIVCQHCLLCIMNFGRLNI